MSISRGALRALLLVALMACSLFPALAQRAGTVDLGKFTLELMQMKLMGDTTELAIWLPYEFFVAAVMSDGTSRADAEESVSVLKAYQMVIVQCSSDKTDGTSVYASEKTVQSRAALRVANGKTLAPLPTVPPMVAAMVGAMKEMFAQKGDASGKNMHVLVFPAKTPEGKTVVDSAKRGSMTLVLSKTPTFAQTIFTWHTPFDAVAGEQVCPACEEIISAKWLYCPWCGAKIL